MVKKYNIILLKYLLFIFFFLATIALFIYVSLQFHQVSKPSTQVTDPKDPIIIIDAGHGGEDGGTIGCNGIYEKDINLIISLNLYDLFKASDIPVILTRETDILLYDRNVDYHGRKKVLDLAKRLEIAKLYENALFISIHQNACSDPKYSGLQVYYSINDKNSAILAEKIQSLARKILQPNNNRKIKATTDNIYLLDNISSPAVLIECGFLSNEVECQLLSTEKYQKELSAVIYASILDYFNETYQFEDINY